MQNVVDKTGKDEIIHNIKLNNSLNWDEMHNLLVRICDMSNTLSKYKPCLIYVGGKYKNVSIMRRENYT